MSDREKTAGSSPAKKYSSSEGAAAEAWDLIELQRGRPRHSDKEQQGCLLVFFPIGGVISNSPPADGFLFFN